MKYRADIDGLRAIAVLSVVAFHLDPLGVKGGFVGVDIFFVISGFLITGHLQSDLQAGRFSLVRFYERRLRRIGPALIAMLAMVSAIAPMVMLPYELRQYGASALAALFSASNLYFWSIAGYFDSPALTKLLLHTWSLAVEEQYYLAFPILLYVSWQLTARQRSTLLAALTILSFAASVYLTFTDPTSAFYLPHTRAWELLIGALLALGIIPAPKAAWLRNLCVSAGMVLILLSFRLIQESTPFPGLAALLPCGGALLVLAGGENGPTWPGRVLQFKPIVFIGLISYSLYLWHWPIIALVRTYFPDIEIHLSHYHIVKAVAFPFFLLVAALSWRFVEQPFRNRGFVSVRALTTFAGISVALLFSCNLFFLVSKGFAGRYPEAVYRVAAFLDYDPSAPFRKDMCFVAGVYHFDKSRCLGTSTDGAYLLLGDSHAAQLWTGMNRLAGAHRLLQASVASCAPVLPIKGDAGCVRLMSYIYQDFLPSHHLGGVILTAHWDMSLLASLPATLDWYAARHVPIILIGPTPDYDTPLPRLLAQALIAHDPALPDRHLIAATAQVDAKLAILASRRHVRYISPYRLLCHDGQCVKWAGDQPLLFDRDHLTAAGSVVVADAMHKADLSLP